MMHIQWKTSSLLTILDEVRLWKEFVEIAFGRAGATKSITKIMMSVYILLLHPEIAHLTMSRSILRI